MNLFLNQLQTKNTFTENGAISHSTSGSALLDQFSKVGTLANVKRTQDEVDADMALIWDENPELAMKAVLYWRMITRQNKGTYKTEKVQKGQGVRHEVFRRLIWVAKRHPEAFYANMHLIPEVGSWKDLITLWEMNSEVITLDSIFDLYEHVFNFDTEAAQFHIENIKKYLPTLRSKKNCNTAHLKKMREFVNAFLVRFGMSERDYRKFKSSGISHKFQRDICNKDFDALNFSTIGGRFLPRLTKSNARGVTFLKKWNLESRFREWLESKSVVNFTGYPYELNLRLRNSPNNLIEEITVNKQFDKLLAEAKKDNGGIKGNVWCALDTSGSMGISVNGDYNRNTVTALDVCVSLGVFFSSLNEGAFKDHVIMFDNVSRIQKISGSFSDKIKQLPQNAMGGTNFQSVIDEIVRVRKANPNIPVSDFPETLLVVSDMQFNPSSSYYYYADDENYSALTETNYETAMRKLEAVGLPRIQIVWWWVTARGNDQPVKMDDKGTVLLGGFDGSIISTILGGETSSKEKSSLTPMDAMLMALDQELLSYVKV